MYADHPGTGLVTILKRPVVSDAEKAYSIVKKAFEEEYDLVWLRPFGFNNTYTLTMRKDFAEKHGIETISDLADYLRK